MYSKQDIEKLTELILEVLTPQKIILFGSYAKGNYTEESDIDLMILIKSELNRDLKRNILYSLRKHLFNQNINIDFVLNTVEKFEAQSKFIGTIFNAVARDGIVLWKKN